MPLIALFKPKGPTGFGYGSSASEATEGVSLAGKTILVTGCNSGLGLESMRVLAGRGAHVIGAARTEAKANEAAATVTGKTTGVACELSDPASVRACVETVKTMGAPLDAIVANAGIMALPKLNQSHGYELQFFTNHVGHFILVTGLLDRLADDGRVVMLSSAAHQMAPVGGISSTICRGSAVIRAGSPMASRRSPTCCSPRSSPAASPARRRPPTPSIPA
jgi:NAD(P)-dependent dehydrogenase (short-subunit alcohol dehydrogenase family)